METLSPKTTNQPTSWELNFLIYLLLMLPKDLPRCLELREGMGTCQLVDTLSAWTFALEYSLCTLDIGYFDNTAYPTSSLRRLLPDSLERVRSPLALAAGPGKGRALKNRKRDFGEAPDCDVTRRLVRLSASESRRPTSVLTVLTSSSHL